MSRAAPPLSQHLLTRSVLAQLGVRASDILHWLAEGSLEIVGALPSEAQEGDPVFAVLDRALQRDLASRLRKVGKEEVVFSMLRVRSVLGRALMALRARYAEGRRDAQHDGDEEPTGPERTDLDRSEAPGLTAAPAAEDVDSSESAVADPNLELTACLELAREEARSDALEREAGAAGDAPASPDDPAGERATDQEEQFLDFRDFADALDCWAESESAQRSADDEGAAANGDEEMETETQFDPDREDDGQGVEEQAAVPCDEPDTETTEPPAGEPAAAEMPPQAVPDDDGIVDPGIAAQLVADDPVEAPGEQPVEEPEPTAAEPAPAAPEVAAVTPAPEPEPALATTTDVAAMQRVESFLGELRGALVDIAHRPQPAAVDIAPLVDAVGEFGRRVEHGVAVGVHAAMGERSQPPAAPLHFVQRKTNYTTLVLFMVAFLLLCWGAIFWFKTGNAQLAFATVVGANLVGCCMLAGRR